MCFEQVESFSCCYSPNNTVLTTTYISFTVHWTFKQPGDYLSHSVGCLHVLCKWHPIFYVGDLNICGFWYLGGRSSSNPLIQNIKIKE